jgi:WD40 repeat protein/uncharacterized caspase-like protein
MKRLALLVLVGGLGWLAPAAGRAAPAKLELVLQTGHAGDIMSVSLSGDGKLALTGSENAILWDARTGRQLWTLRGHVGGVKCVRLSEDGKLALTVGWDNARLWDTRTGKQLLPFNERPAEVPSVSFSADGTLVLIDGRLWDTRTGKQAVPHIFAGGGAYSSSTSLSPDGKRVLVGYCIDYHGNIAILFDVRTGKQLQVFKEKGSSGLVSLNGDGKLVLTGSSGMKKEAILWNAQTGRRLRTFPQEGFGLGTTLSKDGKRALVKSDKSVTLWNARTGRRLRTFSGHTGNITSVALSADTKYVLTGGGREAILWDAQSGKEVQRLRGHTQPTVAVSLSNNGRRILVGSMQRAHLWDTRAGKPTFSFPHGGKVPLMRLSGDGTHALIGAREDTAVLWDARTGKQISTLRAPPKEEWDALGLSDDGKRAFTFHWSRGIVVWDAPSGTQLHRLTGHTRQINAVCISGDGSRLLSGSQDNTAILWDGRTGKPLRTLRGAHLRYVALSRDGRRALTELDRIALWDTETGKTLRTLGSVLAGSVSLSSDASRALTVDKAYDRSGTQEEGSAILWDAETGKVLQTFRGGVDEFKAVSLSGDGKLLLTASREGAPRLWDATTGKELCRLINLGDGKEWLVVTPDGLFDGSAGAPRYLAYRIAGTQEFVSLEKYLHHYYRPGLLADLLKGERPRARVDIARALPPRVRLVSPAASLKVMEGRVEVKAQAHSRGDYPVTALRLMLNNRPYLGDRGVRRLLRPKLGKVEASWTVELEPGRHTLKVLADTALVKGVPSQEVQVSYTGGETKVRLPRLFVLAVGISEHRDRTLNLDFAARDAAAVAEAYQKHSRKLFREVPRARVLRNAEATRSGIIKGLLWLRDNVKQGDYAVFHFAGHGRKDRTDNLFFLPHEADVKDLDGTAISAADMRRYFRGISGRLTVILDACHSGAVASRPRVGGRKRGGDGLTDDLLRDLITEENGVVVMCATTGEEEAHESPEHKRGMFTQALLEGMAGKANKSKDGAVYLHELQSYVTNRVVALSKSRQHPVIYSPDAVRSFPVSKP